MKHDARVAERALWHPITLGYLMRRLVVSESIEPIAKRFAIYLDISRVYLCKTCIEYRVSNPREVWGERRSLRFVPQSEDGGDCRGRGGHNNLCSYQGEISFPTSLACEHVTTLHDDII